MGTSNDFWKSNLKKWTALDPPDRLSEVLFGLIMVLTFTGSISVSTAGSQDLEQLIWAALGCNFAWGLVDAIMGTMDTVIGRNYDFKQIRNIKSAKSQVDSREIIRDSISPLISDLLDDNEIDSLGEKIKKLPDPNIKHALTIKDLLIAFEIFLLVFLSTFPVALPFLLFNDVAVAMRVSNGVALVLMFAAGYALANYSGLRPFRTAITYTGIGIFLVALTMLLGG